MPEGLRCPKQPRCPLEFICSNQSRKGLSTMNKMSEGASKSSSETYCRVFLKAPIGAKMESGILGRRASSKSRSDEFIGRNALMSRQWRTRNQVLGLPRYF